MNADDISDFLLLHIADSVTPLESGLDGYLIDCKCGAEIFARQANIDALDADTTAGAIAALLVPHAAELLAAQLRMNTGGENG